MARTTSCHPSTTQAIADARGERAAVGLRAGRRRALLVGCLLVGALALRVDGIAQPSLATRELHNALLARRYYLGTGAGLPAWKQRVLHELRQSVQPIEPPLLDHVAAWGYRLTGGENLWAPRLVSSLLWVVGGVFLYLIALRLTSREGALVALALHLFWPFGVLISRLYMPDPTMVALILAGALAVIRYWERPTRGRFAAASAVAALATAIKPGIALVFLAALFLALAASERRLRSALARGRFVLFVALAGAPTAAYYVYGTYVRHFLDADADTGERLQPQLLVHGWFWRGWWEMLGTVLPFPQHQRQLALVPIGLALAGVVVARRKRARPILAGLGLGYLVYAVAFAAFTASHPYYMLPLIPIAALAIGALAGAALDRLDAAGASAGWAVAGLVVLVAAVGSYKARPFGPDRAAIADYRRIGEVTGHTTRAIIVDQRLRAPAMYWGWIVGRYWYPPTPSQDLPASGDPFPGWVDPAQASYVVVVGLQELRTERRLRAVTRGLPVVARTSRFAVLDARGGRLARFGP